MSDADKKQCDEAVDGLLELTGVFADVISAKARLTKGYFDALKKEGFSADQALAITAAVETKLS